jgi:hypothetical protein
MFGIPAEDLVFLSSALVGGGLLLTTLLVNDNLASVLKYDVNGVPVARLLFAFACLFGAGGLLALHVLRADDVQAAIAATGAGVVGMGLTFLLHGLVQRAGD